MSSTPSKVTEQASPALTAAPKPKTHTQWDALTKASLRPVTIWCQQYPIVRGQLYRDMSCHSRLSIKDAQALEAHAAGEHGGSYMLCVRQTEGKASGIWADLSERQLEAHDFRCAVCDKQVRLHPTNLAPHLRPHAGMTRQAYGELARNHPGAVGFFNVTLRKAVAPQLADDEPEEQEFSAEDF